MTQRRSARTELLSALSALALASCATHVGPALDPRELVCRRVVPNPERPVDWIAPAAERDRIKLTEWCSVVGPVLYEPYPTPASGPDAPPLDRVAIISWNTHVGGGDLDEVVRRVRAGVFTGGEAFEHVVLLLQEMYRTGSGVPDNPTLHAAIPGRIVQSRHQTHDRDVERLARTHGMAVFYAPSMRNGLASDDPEDRGNAILSTIPLSDPAVIELPFERQRRVVVAASVAGHTSAGGRWQLRLASVHLDTALALMRGGPFRARARQVEELIGSLSESRGPLLVAGDFNTWLGEREPAIAALRRAYRDAAPIAGPTWVGPLGTRGTLDYVFARGELPIQVRRLPGRFGSDHFPLLAVVRF